MKKEKLNATEIVELVLNNNYKEKQKKQKKGMKMSGNDVHSFLGCNNETIFKRYYEYNGDYILLSGKPDKIKKNRIQELKCYRDKKEKIKQIVYGGIQLDIYSYLTGLPNQELFLYDLVDLKLEQRPHSYNEEIFKSNMDKAILVYRQHK